MIVGPAGCRQYLHFREVTMIGAVPENYLSASGRTKIEFRLLSLLLLLFIGNLFV